MTRVTIRADCIEISGLSPQPVVCHGISAVRLNDPPKMVHRSTKKVQDVKKTRYSKFSDRFQEYNVGQKDVITYRRLLNNLNKSNIGKDTVEYILKHPEVKIYMCYGVDVPKDILGYQENDEIYICFQYSNSSKNS